MAALSTSDPASARAKADAATRPFRHPEKRLRPDSPSPRKPAWIRVKAPTSKAYAETRRIVREHGLTTVCEEAGCPNIGECWAQRHATMMIMGEICTRACTFCNVATGKPGALDAAEPENVGKAVAKLGLAHVVVTSVDRDDLDDGGAAHFAETVRWIRSYAPGTTVELLTPDFLRKPGALEIVIAAKPDVLNHNLETVPGLYSAVRPGARYYHSVRLLERAKELDPSVFTKSGIMVGLGETRAQVAQVMDDLRCADVDFLTIGQYLQPTPKHHPVDRFVTPEEFEAYATMAMAKGFLLVSSSPLTRSSYHADSDFAKLKAARGLMPSHREQLFVPYSPDEMFVLVADIERYPEFIPWCAGARIRRREEAAVVADLRVRFGPFRETFTSHVTLAKPERIDVAYLHGPFRHMATHWRFMPAEGGTTIDFSIDCDFRSALLRGLASRFFQEAAKRMALAFEARAHKLYGDRSVLRGERPPGQGRRTDA